MRSQMQIVSRRLLIALLGGAATVAACSALGYPLDGEAESGIRRLEGYRVAQALPTGAKLVSGALLDADRIELRLVGYDLEDFDAQPEDAELARGLERLFSGRDPSYALVVVDMTDPTAIRWAGLRPDTRQNVGSVGKIITMTGLFHVLAEAFPNIEDRRRVLATSVSRGGTWVVGDEHAVPKYDPATQRNTFARLRENDEFRLSEWLDHAISASANGAGSVVWREAILIHEFGDRYPLSFEESEAFFDNTPKARLSQIAQSIMTEPLAAIGIDTEAMRQGSFWTRSAQNRVPGTTSFATPRELARWMFRLEQGRIVDEWSSLEMKKYLYMTKRRYRYIYAPELNASAAFFKSGSLYSCRPEEGYRCARYMGNARNFMNSVATIETPAGAPEFVYTVAMISNVLKFNSAWDHSRFAAAIHEMITTRRIVDVPEEARSGEIEAVTLSD
jgi:Beta-lactamase enzyme family